LPGGLGSLMYQARDGILRQIAIRRRIVVPSLFADVGDIEKVGLGQQRGQEYARQMAEMMAAQRRGVRTTTAGETPPTDIISQEVATTVDLADDAAEAVAAEETEELVAAGASPRSSRRTRRANLPRRKGTEE